MSQFRRFTQGDKLRPTAAQVNAWTDAAVANQRLQRHASSGKSAPVLLVEVLEEHAIGKIKVCRVWNGPKGNEIPTDSFVPVFNRYFVGVEQSTEDDEDNPLCPGTMGTAVFQGDGYEFLQVKRDCDTSDDSEETDDTEFPPTEDSEFPTDTGTDDEHESEFPTDTGTDDEHESEDSDTEPEPPGTGTEDETGTGDETGDVTGTGDGTGDDTGTGDGTGTGEDTDGTGEETGDETGTADDTGDETGDETGTGDDTGEETGTGTGDGTGEETGTGTDIGTGDETGSGTDDGTGTGTGDGPDPPDTGTGDDGTGDETGDTGDTGDDPPPVTGTDGTDSDGSDTDGTGTGSGTGDGTGETGEPPGTGDTEDPGSDKSTAIVPAAWSPTGYAALFVAECPEVRFDDVITIEVPQQDCMIPIDVKYVTVCEPGSIEVCGTSCDAPVSIGARAHGKHIKVRFSQQAPGELVRVVLRLTAIRRGFDGHRFPTRTARQFQANEKFIRSAYPDHE